MLVPNYAASAIAFDKDGKEIKKCSGDEDHYANFIKAVRSRKHEDLNADILEGHLSSALCHTGNISYRLGRKARPSRSATRSRRPRREATFQRMVEHLAANEVDLMVTPATLGALKMDPQTERFVGNARPTSCSPAITAPHSWCRRRCSWSSVIGHRSSVIGDRSSVIGHRSSVIGHRSSVIGHRSSVIGHRSSVLSGRYSLRKVTQSANPHFHQSAT